MKEIEESVLDGIPATEMHWMWEQRTRIEIGRYIGDIFPIQPNDALVFVGQIYKKGDTPEWMYVQHVLTAPSFYEAYGAVVNWIIDHEEVQP